MEKTRITCNGSDLTFLGITIASIIGMIYSGQVLTMFNIIIFLSCMAICIASILAMFSTRLYVYELNRSLTNYWEQKQFPIVGGKT